MKKGKIFKPDGNLWWAKSHAQEPVVELLDNEIFRIYFSGRDIKNKSRTGFIDVDANNPSHILKINKEPILSLGEISSFDDSGVMASCILTYLNKKYLYYTAWHLDDKFPYINSVGLAVSDEEGKSFYKLSNEPLFQLDESEGSFAGTPFVLFDEGIFKMWFLNCFKWDNTQSGYEPHYNIRYAESLDGVNWKLTNFISIDFKNENEAGISSPTIIKENNIFKMWYSYRLKGNYRISKKHSYKIGYAESKDGIEWERKDEDVGIGLSKYGWDSIMIEYPYVIEYKRRKYMFYNGNGFGKTGFGYAVLEN